MTGMEQKKHFAQSVEAEAKITQPTVDSDDVRPDFSIAISGSGTAKEKAEWLLSQLTLDEKIDLLSGIDNMAIKGVPRLGLPRVWCSDATSGVRCFGPGTSFPAAVALAATWDRDCIREVAEAIGDECRAIGISILLGPGVNISRVPTCGRNFEYMGEDPYLAGEMAVSFIHGVQSRGVAATVKHFACNNSEYDRHRMNAVADERTLHEIYLPAFKKAVTKGEVKVVMPSYNPVNGTYASENGYLLKDILRDEWGFNGIVMSDWVSVYSAEGTVKGGLDLEMPSGMFLNRKTLQPLIQQGRIKEADIDEHVARILMVLIESGAYDRPAIDTSKQTRPAAHRDLAQKVAAESVILLKNEGGLLPLGTETSANALKIVVLGPNADPTPTGGGGSSYVKANKSVSIYTGLKNAFSATGQVELVRVKGSVEAATVECPVLSEAGAATIQEADYVVVCAGYNHIIESESFDRSWELPDGQAELICEAARLNPRTIVIVNAGAGFETTSWIDKVPVLIHALYLGVEGGNAMADILTGAVNPSGKLPFTMAKCWEDYPAAVNYPGQMDSTTWERYLGPEVRQKGYEWPAEKLLSIEQEQWDIEYRDSIFVGYRHFDTNHVVPQFPFGFGLSYTSFELSQPHLNPLSVATGEPVHVEVLVKNTGDRYGTEIVQIYVRDEECSVPRPDKELKGFKKVALEAGAEQRIAVTLGPEVFQFYDASRHRWTAEPGTFEVLVGTSSRDIMSAGKVTVR